MKKYCISDIHGNLFAWKNLLNKLCIQPDDEVYILGDVIDRGDHGIEILMDIKSSNFKMLLGNHEYMMLEALNQSYDGRILSEKELYRAATTWAANGAVPTMQAFSNLSYNEQNTLVQWMKQLPIEIPLNIDGKKILLVHAAPSSKYDGTNIEFRSKAEFSVWDRNFLKTANGDNIQYIIGHTPTFSISRDIKNPMTIYELGNIIDIDCGSGTVKILKSIGRLAALELHSMTVTYSDIEGDE